MVVFCCCLFLVLVYENYSMYTRIKLTRFSFGKLSQKNLFLDQVTHTKRKITESLLKEAVVLNNDIHLGDFIQMQIIIISTKIKINPNTFNIGSPHI